MKAKRNLETILDEFAGYLMDIFVILDARG
jgi:hypothetical protein